MQKNKKVLITFIGDIKDYEDAEYTFRENLLLKNSPFYFFNLASKLKIDTIIFFINQSLINKDLVYIFEDIKGININLIEDVLGKSGIDKLEEIENYINQNIDIKVKLVKIDIEDIQETFQKVKETIENLKEDELQIHIDITHSYRHIPLLVLLSLDIISIKSEIVLENILYACSINTQEYEIIELKDYITFMNFSKALKNFIQYGQLHSFAQELKNFSEKSEVKDYADLLEETDFYLNFNYLDEIRKKFKDLNDKLPSVKKEFENPPLNYIYEEFEKFIKTFNKNNISEFQFELAKWHLKYKRFTLGLIALREALISRYIEKYCDKDKVNNKKTRDDVAKLFNGNFDGETENLCKKDNNSKFLKEYKEFWKILSLLRNISAHNLGGDEQKVVRNFNKYKNKNIEFLKTLKPNKLNPNFPSSLDEIFNSI